MITEEKIFLDTDIGTDIDDALCLAYLLKKPECDLVGITTVTGEPEKRAMLASVLCKIAGKDIPIYPGFGTPIKVKQQQPVAQQAKFLENWDHNRHFPKGEALEFMRKTIYENPGEITLLTIGPLTNIGQLFKLDPEVPGLLKGLVMMNGYFFGNIKDAPECEWNASGDPHASRIVYNARIKKHRAIGLDVTSRVTCTSGELKSRFQADILEPVHEFAQAWYEYSNLVTFHDPLAAVSIFRKDICNFRKGVVTVETKPDASPGKTTFSESVDSGRNEVAYAVKPELFFEEYLEVVT